MQSALQSAQTQLQSLGKVQHAQWTHSAIPTLSLQSDVKACGGRLKIPLNPPQIIKDIQSHMEAVRKGKS